MESACDFSSLLLHICYVPLSVIRFFGSSLPIGGVATVLGKHSYVCVLQSTGLEAKYLMGTWNLCPQTNEQHKKGEHPTNRSESPPRHKALYPKGVG